MKKIFISSKNDNKIIFEVDNKWDALLWLNSILISTAKFNFLEELNNMQSQAGSYGVFEGKQSIPIYFVNLIIKDFGLEMSEIEVPDR